MSYGLVILLKVNTELADSFDLTLSRDAWNQKLTALIHRDMTVPEQFKSEVRRALVRVFDAYACPGGTLEAGYGGRLIRHFNTRSKYLVAEVQRWNLPTQGDEYVLSAALVSASMCACNYVGNAARHQELLDALWEQMYETSDWMTPPWVHLLVMCVLRALEPSKKHALQLALLWMGKLPDWTDEGAPKQMRDKDLAKLVGKQRRNFVVSKDKGVLSLLFGPLLVRSRERKNDER